MTAIKRAEHRAAVARVQEIIAAQGGAPLGGAGIEQLEAALSGTFGGAPRMYADEQFESREVTVLLADLRGFMAITATHPVGVVLAVLNRYLVRMSQVIDRNHGVIDKFMGDSIMVLFGAPIARADDVQNALTCAVEMQNAMVGLNEEHRPLGLPELYMGIGINTGTVMAGLLGSDLYSEYTVIGHEVNVASRIECVSLRGQILINQPTFERSGGFVLTGEPMDVLVKGGPEPVFVREVLAIPTLNLEVARQETRRSPRVEVAMPFTYQRVEDKIVLPARQRGTIVDLSYNGMLVEMEESLPRHADIKLSLELPLVGRRATDIYAKTLNSLERDGRRLAGIELTSLSAQDELDLRHFVQLLIQSR